MFRRREPFQFRFFLYPMYVCVAIAAIGVSGYPSTVHAGKIASLYLEPHLGAARVILRAVEIERSFVSSIAQEEVSYDWTDINPSGVIAPVGRMISYKGSGLEAGWTTGLKISGLKVGFTFTWINVSFAGYSKRYRYSPELMRAQGRKYWDTDTVPVFRLLGSVKYGVPLWKLLINFQTRVGSMVVKNTGLIVGRAVEEKNGLTADVGLEVTLRPNKWISVGVLGYGGFFAFAGQYEGGMGALFGGNGVFCLYF